MKSTLKNMVVVLFTITLVGSVSVGVVYRLTKEPIAQAKMDKTNKAIKEVVPSFDNDPASEVFTREVDGESVRIYPAKMGGEVTGYAIETFSNNAFAGKIVLMVGMLVDGTIKSIAVVEQKETPGLGDKIERSKSDFSVQFEGKNPETFRLAVREDGGDVDAITASTISSRAYADAVGRAYKIFKALP